jgi:hypothetical protein
VHFEAVCFQYSSSRDLLAAARALSQLNLAVRRNTKRFPEDFMFQLSPEEYECLRFQIETSKKQGRGGRRYLPYVFTEHGVTMLASVLNSERAIRVNVTIVRAFVQLRSLLDSHRNLAAKLDQLERKYDHQLKKPATS